MVNIESVKVVNFTKEDPSGVAPYLNGEGGIGCTIKEAREITQQSVYNATIMFCNECPYHTFHPRRKIKEWVDGHKSIVIGCKGVESDECPLPTRGLYLGDLLPYTTPIHNKAVGLMTPGYYAI